MAKALKLRFRVINAGVAVRESAIEHDGQPAVLQQRILHVDAEPIGGSGPTLGLELPAADYEDKIAAGDVLNVTIAIDAAADAAATEN